MTRCRRAPRRRPPRWIYAALGATAATVLGFVPAHAAADESCQQISVPVALAEGAPNDQRIVGTLCEPDGEQARDEIDLLVHGGSYSRVYWDFPVDPDRYSHLRRTAAQGRAAMAIDLVGVGQSSKPLSAAVTNVFAVHQVIQWLRTTRGYDGVTVIGHSLGSATTILEAATYQDVDRLIVTSFLHPFNTVGLAPAVASLYPATLDDKFRGDGLDPGYITTIPGRRGPLFYTAEADPEVIAADERTKDIVSAREMAFSFEQLLTPSQLNATGQVTAPVLVVVGQQDALFCGPPTGIDCSSEHTVAAHERPFYGQAAELSVRVVPRTSHNIALHPTVDESFEAISKWIAEH